MLMKITNTAAVSCNPTHSEPDFETWSRQHVQARRVLAYHQMNSSVGQGCSVCGQREPSAAPRYKTTKRFGVDGGEVLRAP